MKEEVIEPVLQEMLEEIKQLAEEVKRSKKTNEEAIELLKKCDNKLSEIKVNASEVNLSPVNKTIENGISRITNAIEAQPKIIRREFHFHFFPKINIKEYYQTYSRFVLFAILLLLAFGLVEFSFKWIDGYNQRKYNVEQNEALQWNKENDFEPESKRNKAKISNFANEKIKRMRIVHDKFICDKRQYLDSVKNVIKNKIQHLNYRQSTHQHNANALH